MKNIVELLRMSEFVGIFVVLQFFIIYDRFMNVISDMTCRLAG